MIVSLAGKAPPTVEPMPSVRWADAGAQKTHSEVAEQPAMSVIPLPTMGRMGLPTVAGATQPVRTPPTQVEVAAAMTGGSQSGIIVAAPEEPA